MHSLITISLLFQLFQTPFIHLNAPPPPQFWFVEHFELKPFELPSGVSTSIVNNDYGQEYLVITNSSPVNLYVVGSRSDGGMNFDDINIEFSPGIGPLYKVVDGEAYFWRNGWSQNGLLLEEIDSIWLHISWNSIRCENGNVLDLEPRNPDSNDRPADVIIPDPQEVLLPIIYGEEYIDIPITISYTLNEDYKPYIEKPNIFDDYTIVYIIIGIGIMVLTIIFGFSISFVLKWIANRKSRSQNA